MHAHHIKMYLNGMDDFVRGEKMWKMIFAQENPHQPNTRKYHGCVFCFGDRLSVDNPNVNGETLYGQRYCSCKNNYQKFRRGKATRTVYSHVRTVEQEEIHKNSCRDLLEVLNNIP